MGYESRLYIGVTSRHLDTVTKAPLTIPYCRGIAVLDLCKMRMDFPEIFDTPVDFHMYRDDGDTLIDKDDYGAKCKYTSLDKVYAYLEKELEETKDSPYRRTKFAYNFLKGLKEDRDSWELEYTSGGGTMTTKEEIVIVHYGY